MLHGPVPGQHPRHPGRARRRAEDAAAQLGQRITGVQSVDTAPGVGDFGDEFLSGDDSGEGAAGGGGGTRVLPGEEEFIAIVRVVYTVAPAS